jgi:hypothetical protein
MTTTALVQADVAAVLAARLSHLAVRLDAAAVELVAADPVPWRGPARDAFVAARSVAMDRLAAAAGAAHAAASIARRAALLAETALP